MVTLQTFRTLMFCLCIGTSVVSCTPSSEHSTSPPKPVPTFFLIRENEGWDAHRGFIDRSGHVVATPRFADMNDFSEGMAAVRIDDKWGYVDASGQVVIPANFFSALDFSEGLAAVDVGGMPPVDGKWGYIDHNGQMMIPAQFKAGRSRPTEFRCGRAFVRKDNGGFACIDRNGNVVFEMDDAKGVYLSGNPFSEGLSGFWSGHKCGFVDTTGKRVTDLIYDRVGTFAEGMAAVAVQSTTSPNVVTLRWGFVDKQGKEVTPTRFVEVKDFSEGLAAVAVDSNGQRAWGYIDKKGRWAISPRFDESWQFHGGIARIRKGRYSTDATYGFIDMKGKPIVEPQFVGASDFSEGFAAVAVDTCVDLPIEYCRAAGFIDQTGKMRIPPRYKWEPDEDNASLDFHGGLAYGRNGELAGYFDTTGAFVWQSKWAPSRELEYDLRHERKVRYAELPKILVDAFKRKHPPVTMKNGQRCEQAMIQDVRVVSIEDVSQGLHGFGKQIKMVVGVDGTCSGQEGIGASQFVNCPLAVEFYEGVDFDTDRYYKLITIVSMRDGHLATVYNLHL